MFSQVDQMHGPLARSLFILLYRTKDIYINTFTNFLPYDVTMDSSIIFQAPPQVAYFYAPRKISGEHIVVALSVRLSIRPSVRPIRVRPITSLFEVGFRKYFTEMITILRRRVVRNIWVPTLKVKVTARPCSKFVSGP